MLLRCLVALWVVYALADTPNVRKILNQCADVQPLGQICIDVTSQDCFELSGKVTLGGSTVWGPRQISIPRLVELAQAAQGRSSGPLTVCESMDIAPCSVCNVVDKLKIDGDDLHYCGKFQVNCTIPVVGVVKREIALPCVNITDCHLFGCQNNCNGGNCSALGVCQCKHGTYGPDCSVSVKDSCIESQWWSKTCWKADFPDCHTVAFSVGPAGLAATVNTQKISQVSELTLVPCQQLAQEPACQICVNAEQIHVEGTKLMGCPRIKLSCAGVDVNSYQIDCIPLATSNALQCSTNPPDVSTGGDSNGITPAGTWGMSKVILMILVVVLGLGILAVGTYFAYTRYKQWKQGKTFERVPVGNVQDEFESMPLGRDDGSNENSLDDG